MTRTYSHDLIALGRAYTDMIATVNADFFSYNCLQPSGAVMVDENRLQELATVLPNPILSFGGSSANVASVMAALGGQSCFGGKLRHDRAGEAFADDMHRRGVEFCWTPFIAGSGTSPTCLVLAQEADKECSYVYNPGCADWFEMAECAALPVNATRFLLLEGFLLCGRAREPLIELLSRARGNCCIVINLQIGEWPGDDRMMNDVATYADIIIGNKEEWAQFDPSNYVASQSNCQHIITDGARGSLARCGNSEIFIPALSVPNLVSLLGAGDAYLAGLLYAMGRGSGTDDAMIFATKVAAAILMEVGARPSANFKSKILL